MTSPVPHPRYERKCLAPSLSLAEVVSIVRRNPALFREVYPPRAVNNIYLDSVGFQDYLDHVRGVCDRLKTRIRWYGPLNGHVASPNLERKIKRGSVGGKLVHPLPDFAINGHVARQVLDASFQRADVPETLRWALRGLQPAIVNRYQRRYWLSACGRIRLTLDWGLEFFNTRAVGPSAVPAGLRVPMVIVELKFDPQHACVAAAVANALPFRLARCSKYVLGIERLGR